MESVGCHKKRPLKQCNSWATEWIARQSTLSSYRQTCLPLAAIAVRQIEEGIVQEGHG